MTSLIQAIQQDGASSSQLVLRRAAQDGTEERTVLDAEPPKTQDIVAPFSAEGGAPGDAGVYGKGVRVEAVSPPSSSVRTDVSAAPSFSLFSRATCFALAGIMGVLPLVGCNNNNGTPRTAAVGTTHSTTDAQGMLAKAFDDAEKAIAQSNSGDPQKAAADVTRNLFGQIEQYAQKTGKSAEAVADDVRSYAVAHPAVSLTVLLAVGITSGVILEKYGVPETIASGAGSILESVTSGTGRGLSAIKEQIKQHPYIAIGIGLALAGAVTYVIHEVRTSSRPPAAIPDTPQKQQLVKSLDALEEEVARSNSANAEQDAKRINARFMDTVQEYAKSTGRSAKEVAEDIKGFMVTHPGVTAAVVLSAGVTTGILLEKAGVPSTVAGMAASGFDAAKAGASNGLSTVVTAVKEHPVLSTVIIASLAAGVGYVVYNHFSSSPAQPLAPPN